MKSLWREQARICLKNKISLVDAHAPARHLRSRNQIWFVFPNESNLPIDDSVRPTERLADSTRHTCKLSRNTPGPNEVWVALSVLTSSPHTFPVPIVASGRQGCLRLGIAAKALE